MAFQKSSWADISTLLLKAVKCAYEKGLLSISQRSDILSLIPKENKIHCFIKKWRPITLLNTNYRIFAKAIANRIKKVLLYLTNSDRTGFLKERFILNYKERSEKISKIINDCSHRRLTLIHHKKGKNTNPLQRVGQPVTAVLRKVSFNSIH